MRREQASPGRVLLAGASALGGAHALPALAAAWPPLRAALWIADRIRTPGAVALTFDDGPHPRGTPAVLETLRAARRRATFFLVGEQVARNPALAAEIAAAGHEIALHCDRHRNLLRLPPRLVRDDLERALERITLASGVVPRVYRPPYGVFTLGALLLARRRHWLPLLWTRDGRDWQARATPQSIAARLVRDVAAGDVLLLHDADDYSAAGSWRRTAQALPRVLEELERRELKPAAVSA